MLVPYMNLLSFIYFVLAARSVAALLTKCDHSKRQNKRFGPKTTRATISSRYHHSFRQHRLATPPTKTTSTSLLLIINMADDNDGWESVPSKTVQKRQARQKRQQEQEQTKPQGPHVLPWIAPIPVTPQNTQYQPFMILLCGIPGSGKSTLANSLQHAMPFKFVRINQDELGNRRRCEEVTRAVLSNPNRKSQLMQCPVIDRCNFDPEQRAKFVAIAQEFNVPVDCIVFESESLISVDECIQRCETRRNHPTVKPKEARGIVMGMAQQMKPPLATGNPEGIREVRFLRDSNALNDTVVEYLNRLM